MLASFRFLVLLGLWLSVTAALAGDPATHTPVTSIEQVRKSIATWRSHFKSLEVAGEITAIDHTKKPPTVQRIKMRFAAWQDWRFSDVIHCSEDSPPELDELRNQFYLCGDDLHVFYPLQRRCEHLHGKAVRAEAHVVRAGVLLECLGWWPPEDATPTPLASNRPFFLHEALAQKEYRVLSEPEWIDGDCCCVVESSGVDKIWLDPSKGFTLRRRECYQGPKAVLAFRYDLSDYHQDPTGIWLPRTIQWRRYDVAHATAGSPPPLHIESTISLARVVANRANKGLFRFNPPPGTLFWDRTTDQRNQIPGGLSFLEEVVSLARARGACRASRVGQPDQGTLPSTRRYWTFLLVILVLVSMDLILLWRILRAGQVNSAVLQQALSSDGLTKSNPDHESASPLPR